MSAPTATERRTRRRMKILYFVLAFIFETIYKCFSVYRLSEVFYPSPSASVVWIAQSRAIAPKRSWLKSEQEVFSLAGSIKFFGLFCTVQLPRRPKNAQNFDWPSVKLLLFSPPFSVLMLFFLISLSLSFAARRIIIIKMMICVMLNSTW